MSTDTTDTPLLYPHPAACPCCSGASAEQPQAAGSPPTVQYPSGLHRIGDLNLDAILAYRNEKTSTGVYTNGTARWNMDKVVGQEGLKYLDELRNTDVGVGSPVVLQYHFMTALPSYYTEGTLHGPASSFRPLSDDEKSIVLEELAKISAVSGITFVESTSGAAGKTLSFGVAELKGASGVGYYPSFRWTTDDRGVTGATPTEQAGDVYLRRLGLDNYAKDGLTDVERAGIAGLVRHEIGHALGLAHPFDGDVTLPDSAQNKLYTMMGYSDANDTVYGLRSDTGQTTSMVAAVDTLGILDIIALQKLYWENPNTNFGNDTYTWDQKVGFRAVLYDAGGIDTIDLSGSSMRSSIDLTPNSLSSVNLRVTEAEIRTNLEPWYFTSGATYRGSNNLGIVGTIENVRAGAGDDKINGNAAANEISGGAGNDSVWGGAGDDRLSLGSGNDHAVAGTGNDTVDGGSGVDIAGLFGPRSSYSIARQADGSLVVSGPEGGDTYANMEFLAFNDGGKVRLWLSGGFDEAFYLAANPDVAAAVEAGALRSGWEHYQAYGKAEGRMATVLFDKDYYLSHNSDVKAAGMDAWTHFMNYGWREGRDPSVYLDVSAYLDANSDLRAAGVNPLSHYMQYGQGEGRLLVATSDLAFDWTYMG